MTPWSSLDASAGNIGTGRPVRVTKDVGVGLRDVAPLVDDLDRPEAVAASADGGTLYAGGATGQLYEVALSGGTPSTRVVASVDAFALGLCLDRAGRVYMCAGDRIVRVDPRDGTWTPYCVTTDDGPLVLPNFAVFEADGHLLVSDSGDSSADGRPGRILRIPPGGGTAEVVRTPRLRFPNGLALDERGLFIVESRTGRVLLLTRGGDIDVFAVGPEGVPDGLALDRDGNLLVSYFQPNRVESYAPNGGRRLVLDDPSGWHVLTPTNLAFYGPDRRQLALASLCGWGLTTMPVDVPGMPLNYPFIDPPQRGADR